MFNHIQFFLFDETEIARFLIENCILNYCQVRLDLLRWWLPVNSRMLLEHWASIYAASFFFAVTWREIYLMIHQASIKWRQKWYQQFFEPKNQSNSLSEKKIKNQNPYFLMIIQWSRVDHVFCILISVAVWFNLF